MNKKLLLVGGMSGIGKTTIINELIEMYDMYERPISYTTRSRRNDESDREYKFCSEEQMLDAYNDGEFLTIDKVYGNSYAILKSSIDKIIGRHKIPIKEIHPTNHNKIKSLYPNSLSIIIVCYSNITVEENLRLIEDVEYYKDLDLSSFDIVFVIDRRDAIDMNCRNFNLKIMNTLKYFNSLPHPGDIDKKNIIGYTKLSKEFTDEKRVTTKNFHDLSADFFKNFLSERIQSPSSVLEIGAGRGWLRKNFDWPANVNYFCSDISQEMINNCNERKKHTTSVRFMPFSNGVFDYVIASLADPFFYPEAICEINRVIKLGGLFVFSIPSDMWAKALRKDDLNQTRFYVNENPIDVYSFTYERKEMISMLNDCGFECIEYNRVLGKSLTKGDTISPAITEAAKNISTSIEKLDILTTCIFRKI